MAPKPRKTAGKYTPTFRKTMGVNVAKLADTNTTMTQIPETLLGDGFTQDQFGHPICPCGNKTEVDGNFPCEHENPLNGLI